VNVAQKECAEAIHARVTLHVNLYGSQIIGYYGRPWHLRSAGLDEAL
jgi:hypothetical protein